MGKKFPYIFFKFQDGPDAGKDEQVKVHTRSIGDKSYTVKRVTSNEVTEEEVVEGNNWTSDEKLAFIEDWDKNWNPSYLETGSLNLQLENPGSSNTLVEKVDHQLEVDGVIYRKLRTINRVVSQVFLQIFN